MLSLQLVCSLSIVLCAVVLVLLERRFPYREGQHLLRSGFWNDLVGYTLIQSYVLGLVIAQIINLLDIVFHQPRLSFVHDWSVPVQLLAFFVVHDFYIYWFHRWQHHNKYLWRLHEAHHSTPDVDWLSGSRSHPLEILINQTVEFAPMILLGAAPEVITLKAAIDAVWGMYIHANIDVQSGLVQRVLNGPEMHRWHHTASKESHHFNFSTKLAIWDWIFGTAYLPVTQKPDHYGLKAPGFPTSYVDQVLYAFRPRHRPAKPKAER